MKINEGIIQINLGNDANVMDMLYKQTILYLIYGPQGDETCLWQVSKNLKIGTCPASQLLLPYMGKN